MIDMSKINSKCVFARLSLSAIFSTICFCFHVLNASVLTVTQENLDAMRYVGENYPEVGVAQLELLRMEGLQKDSHVLEIGCGALVAAIPIMSFLAEKHYVGIDPNRWLIDASLKIQENCQMVAEKLPTFLYNENFNAKSLNITFDFILAHSVLSHAALWQVQLFLKVCASVLADNGTVIFSLRLTEPNEYDPSGTKIESTTDQWQYPGNTFFRKETIVFEASKWFRKIEHKPSYTKIIMSIDKSSYHDWFVLTK